MRPFHTLNPALARFDDGRVMPYGTMGGEGQPQTQAAVFSRYGLLGQELQTAVTAPRWLLGRTWGDVSTSLKLENRFDASLVNALEEAGHKVEVLNEGFSDTMGHAGAVVRHATGVIEGAADPRSDGLVAGARPGPGLRRCSLKLTLVGEAAESKVSFQARPRTHTPGPQADFQSATPKQPFQKTANVGMLRIGKAYQGPIRLGRGAEGYPGPFRAHVKSMPSGRHSPRRWVIRWQLAHTTARSSRVVNVSWSREDSKVRWCTSAYPAPIAP